MRKLLNTLAVILICLGAGLGAFCAATALLPEAGTLGRSRITSDAGEAAEAPQKTEEKTQAAADAGSREEEPEEAPAEEPENPEDGEFCLPGRLAYSLLDEEARQTYDEMLEAVENHREETELTTVDEDVLPRAFEALTSDHGEIFWVSGYRYVKESLGEQVRRIRFQRAYTMTEDERAAYQEQTDRVLEKFWQGADKDSSDYEKVKAVYENLAVNVRYNESAAENQNILSVFLGGQSVCNGIAAAAQYLLTCLDVPCMTVYGQAGGESHAWNLVMIGGRGYLFDATWGNNA